MSSTGSELRVAGLWRYPIKSMLGQPCQTVRVDPRGFRGDRLFALLAADGRIGSHKSSRRFVKLDGLFDLYGLRAAGETRVTFPDGTTLAVTADEIADKLSRHVGQQVEVVRETSTPHQDAAPVHILSTASLRWLDERIGTADVRRFRPNLVIDAPGVGLPEHEWVGQTLRCGDAEFRVTELTRRCVMTTLAQEELPRDPAVLRQLGQETAACFGVYATVVRPGRVDLGDEVRCTDR